MNALQNAREQSVELAAQNMSAQPAGAFTGEISARMVKECGCKHVILGHSERRPLPCVGNFSALEALDRELKRAMEEEEFLMTATLMLIEQE